MKAVPPGIPQRRVFFALWPGAAVRRQLVALQRDARAASGGRAMQPGTLHLTLAFLGGIDGERVPAAEAVAATLKVPAFKWSIDRLACWHHKHIVWAGAEAVPDALAQLVATLSGGLREAGFALEERPFAAHVTLLRNATGARDLRQARPILWSVGDFVLVESKLSAAGACYEVIGRWSLL